MIGSGDRAPPVEHRCNAHISICKCNMPKENFICGVERAKHEVDKLLRKRDRHWRGQALFGSSIPGDGEEHYSWADILVQSPLHRTCFAVLHAVSPKWPRPNFHMSFDSRPPKPEPRQQPPVDQVRPN